MHQFANRTYRCAFTLIELFAVIGIIVILISMLVPAVMAAKEKARRRTCLGNLQELGMALQSYVNDYSGYLPSWVGVGADDWGSHPTPGYRQCAEKVDGFCSKATTPAEYTHAPAWDSYGQYSANILKGTYGGRGEEGTIEVGMHSTDFDYYGEPLSYYRLIASGGQKTPGSPLNQGPHGLGFLLVGGYLDDAKVFYCPSSVGMPPDLMVFPGGDSLDDWKAAGGFDAKTMVYGNFPVKRKNLWMQQSCIWSHYAYRGVPITATLPWCAGREDKDEWISLRYTKPRQFAHFGAPFFRTEKELGGRAIIADGWSKSIMVTADVSSTNWANIYMEPWEHWSPMSTPASGRFPSAATSHPGVGIMAHREGYNVLYGDGHASFYGDKEQRIIWQDQGTGSWTSPSAHPWSKYWDNDLLSNQTYALTHGSGPLDDPAASGDDPTWLFSGAAIWHQFDNVVGIDKF